MKSPLSRPVVILLGVCIGLCLPGAGGALAEPVKEILRMKDPARPVKKLDPASPPFANEGPVRNDLMFRPGQGGPATSDMMDRPTGQSAGPTNLMYRPGEGNGGPTTLQQPSFQSPELPKKGPAGASANGSQKDSSWLGNILSKLGFSSAPSDDSSSSSAGDPSSLFQKNTGSSPTNAYNAYPTSAKGGSSATNMFQGAGGPSSGATTLSSSGGTTTPGGMGSGAAGSGGNMASSGSSGTTITAAPSTSPSSLSPSGSQAANGSSMSPTGSGGNSSTGNSGGNPATSSAGSGGNAGNQPGNGGQAGAGGAAARNLAAMGPKCPKGYRPTGNKVGEGDAIECTNCP